MLALWRDFGFTLSILFVVVITVAFTVVFSASPQFGIMLLVLGLLTAFTEYFLRTDSEKDRPRPFKLQRTTRWIRFRRSTDS